MTWVIPAWKTRSPPAFADIAFYRGTADNMVSAAIISSPSKGRGSTGLLRAPRAVLRRASAYGFLL